MADNGNEKITHKQWQAIDALVMLGTVKKAVAATGIAERLKCWASTGLR